MKTETQIYIAVAALAAIGFYFYAKKNTELAGWKKGYTVLADQINAGTPAQVTQ
jgi:hypothetical protein